MVLIAHIVLYDLGLLFLALAFIAGLLVLMQHYWLKRKQLAPWQHRLPSIEWLDQATIKFLLIGFPCMSVGLVIGFILAHHQWQDGWQRDPVVFFSLLCWAWYAFMLLSRLLFGWRGRKLALLNIVGFITVLGIALGVDSIFHVANHRKF